MPVPFMGQRRKGDRRGKARGDRGRGEKASVDWSSPHIIPIGLANSRSAVFFCSSVNTA
ncbi:hypothetical protein GCM10007856_49650 [Azospirillum oryzae]|nr:hypothetical protein GCM10007856_49650 [Azospirillum oryzae]